MGKATVYCETCGGVIPGDDFAKGRAVRYQEKDYCSKCKEEISHLLKPAEDADALARKTSRIRTFDPTISGNVRKSSDARSSSSVRRTVQAPAVGATPARKTHHTGSGNGHREHPSQLRTPIVHPPRPPSTEKKMYLIAGAAVFLVVVILAVASISKKNEEESDLQKRAVRDKVAREAYENCKRYRDGAPHDVAALLNLIAESKAAVAGTDWEVHLAQLQKEAEETRRAQERREEIARQMDMLRARIGQEPRAATEIKEKLEALRGELPDDKELQERISTYIEEARRAEFQCAFDDVNTFVQTNPTEYKEALDRYDKLREELESYPRDYQDQMLPQIEERIRWTKEARENDASNRWAIARANAETARGRKDYSEAMREVRNFLANDDYAMCKVMDEARAYLRELEQEEQAWKEQESRQPPPGPEPGPGPGPEPLAGSVSLFDGVNRPGKTLGSGKAAWEVVNGELRVKHQDPTLPPQDKIEVSDIILFDAHQVEACVLEFEAKVIKGGLGVFLGMRQEGSNMKWLSGNVVFDPTGGADWHRFRIEYDGQRITCQRDGGATEYFAIVSPGRGSPAFGVYPGCEVHLRNINLTVK